ncbi:MAG: radical SAM protein [Deltaproteobacteria bacterium]|nr:radical SAM protein [Deltaproteobacteria bacterium]
MPNSIKPLIVPVFIPNAGCPHRCVFCNQSTITGMSAAHLSPKFVEHQIESFLAGCRISSRRVQIAFYGGNFLGLDKSDVIRLLSVASGYVTKGIAHSLRFSTRPDTIDSDRLESISGFPVATVELGVQSMNDTVLARANRGHGACDTRAAVTSLKRAGYEIGLQLMVGLPGDTATACLQSARETVALKPDFVRIYPTLVIAGSALARFYAQGRYRPWTLEKSVSTVKQMMGVFARNAIPVIRMGLQPTADLIAGSSIIAGPFHPSFGHLVKSEIYFDRAMTQIQQIRDPLGSPVTLWVHPRSVSQMQGLNKSNIKRLALALDIETVSVKGDPDVREGRIVIRIGSEIK